MFSFMLFSQLATRDQKIKDTENRIETEVSNIGAVASLKSSPDPDSCDEMSCSSPGLFWGLLAGIKANVTCSIYIRLFLSNFCD